MEANNNGFTVVYYKTCPSSRLYLLDRIYGKSRVAGERVSRSERENPWSIAPWHANLCADKLECVAVKQASSENDVCQHKFQTNQPTKQIVEIDWDQLEYFCAAF